jgi:antitoxin component of MazEF toxin-antitoxin module
MISLYVPPRILRGRLLRWGNSFGIRVTKAEADALSLKPGQNVELLVRSPADRIDLSSLPYFKDEPDVSDRHDELVAQASRRDLEKPRRR